MLKSMAIFYYSKYKKRYLHAYKNVYLWVCTVLTVNEYTRTLLNTCFADPLKHSVCHEFKAYLLSTRLNLVHILHKVIVGKRCAVTLNQVSRSWQGHCWSTCTCTGIWKIIFSDYNFFPLGLILFMYNPFHTLTKRLLIDKVGAVTLNEVSVKIQEHTCSWPCKILVHLGPNFFLPLAISAL